MADETTTRAPMSMDEVRKQGFSLMLCLDGEDGGTMFYRCESLGIGMERHTPKKDGLFIEEAITYHIDGDECEYHTIGQVVNRLRELGRVE